MDEQENAPGFLKFHHEGVRFEIVHSPNDDGWTVYRMPRQTDPQTGQLSTQAICETEGLFPKGELNTEILKTWALAYQWTDEPTP